MLEVQERRAWIRVDGETRWVRRTVLQIVSAPIVEAPFIEPAAANSEPKRQLEIRQCVRCGAEYTTRLLHQRFCSKTCRTRHRSEAVAECKRREAERSTYAWRRRVAGHVPKEWRDVLSTGDKTCGICGGPIDAALRFPDPAASSFDHIIPIAQGGPHVLDNLQLAHWACNMKKGAGYGQEVPHV